MRCDSSGDIGAILIDFNGTLCVVTDVHSATLRGRVDRHKRDDEQPPNEQQQDTPAAAAARPARREDDVDVHPERQHDRHGGTHQ